MRTLIDFTASRIKDWPRPRNQTSDFINELPVELQQQIRDLLGRLSLPENVSFEDLVWAVRQQQGVLSELDTAILFLDEWQKMYKKALLKKLK